MSNKTSLDEALLDFADKFDEVVFEANPTDKNCQDALNAYVLLRTELSRVAIIKLKSALEDEPELHPKLSDTPTCVKCDTLSTGKSELGHPHGSSLDALVSSFDIAVTSPRNEAKRARMRRAAATIFEGFTSGLQWFGSGVLSFDHDDCVWRIYWCKKKVEQTTDKESSTNSIRISRNLKGVKDIKWSWTLASEYLAEQREESDLSDLYALGHKQAIELIRKYSGLVETPEET